MKSFYFILAAVVILLLDSCTTAEKLTHKALAKNRAVVAAITRAEFPCIVAASDTVTTTDTLYDFIECPEVTTGYEPARVDTVYKDGKVTTVTRTVKVPVALPVKNITIIQKIEDSAKTEIVNAILNDQKMQIDRLTVKTKNRNNVIKWLIIALAGAGLALFLKIKRIL